MAGELKDFRGKITAETDCVLEALSRSSGSDRSEIVRRILDDWARERLHEHKIMGQLIKAQGIEGN